jgi:O-succinylbenzoate synthase
VKLSGFGLYRYDLPFTEPLDSKSATLRNRQGLLLRLTGDDGSEGWGEAAPLPGFSRETLDEAASQLRELGTSLVGREISLDWMDPDAKPGRAPDLAGLAPSARFGVELAIWNLLSAASGNTILCRPVETVWLNGLLSGSAKEVLAEARRMTDAGYCAVKLKVGQRTVKEDSGLIHAVSGILGDGVSLRLDANRAWNFDEAREFARSTADLSYEYIEEPLADAALLPRFVSETGAPVALDESLVDMAPEDLSNHGYARAVVLKPTLLGGISYTLRIAEQARRFGIPAVISSAYESGMGTLGLISLAATTGEAPAGLDTYRRLAGDVFDPPLNLSLPCIDVRATLDTLRKVDLDSLDLIAKF